MISVNFLVMEMEKIDDFVYGYGEKDDEIICLFYYFFDVIGFVGLINVLVIDMFKWVEFYLGDG